MASKKESTKKSSKKKAASKAAARKPIVVPIKDVPTSPPLGAPEPSMAEPVQPPYRGQKRELTHEELVANKVRGRGDRKPPYPYPRAVVPYEKYRCQEYRHLDQWIGEIVPAELEVKGVVDVGGGNGVMALGWWKARGAGIKILDIFDGYQHQPPAGSVFKCGDAVDIVKHFGAKSADVVQATELLEHMPKEKGQRLLPLLETVAKSFVLITTPCGFSYQPEEVQGNPHQVHICGWDPEELLEHGYQVLINGPERASDPKKPHDKPQIVAWKRIE